MTNIKILYTIYFNLGIVLLLLAPITSMNTSLYAETVPPEEMAKRYQQLNESDWGQISTKLDSLLELTKLTDISEQSRFDYLCLLERVKRINWSKDTKQEVADHLWDIAMKMLSRQNYLGDYASTNAPSVNVQSLPMPFTRTIPCDIIASIIEIQGYLSDSLDIKELDALWNRFALQRNAFSTRIRNALIQSVQGQIRFSESVDLLKNGLSREKITFLNMIEIILKII